jgi:hypothetical protein
MSAEERRELSQETLENSKAIARLTAISENTTKDIDKLVKHIDKILPVHEQIANIKKIMYSAISVATIYGAWQVLGYFDLRELVINQKTNYENIKSHVEHCNDKINENKNQITYLKGRIKQ